MQTFRVNTLAAVIAAVACGSAWAQQSQPVPAQAAAQSAAPQAAQQGVVYPGRPIQAQAAPQQNLPGQPSGMSPTAPGTPIAQMPAMPAVGANAPAMPPQPVAPNASQLYLDDNMPKNLPVTIEEFKRRLDASQRAAAAFVTTAPKPHSGSITITQAPGEPSPSVRLFSGVPTNVVFTDTTGAPWPIEFATPGDPSIADVLVPVEGSATVQIRPKLAYAYGAVSVNLKGNPVPVTLILATAQKEVDTRLDIRVARRGPNAQAPVIDRPSFTNADEAMLAVLDGVPPAEAKSLKTSNGGLKAWSFNNQLYVRTNVPIVSPAYRDSAASVDGMRAYVLPHVPFVTVSIDGVLHDVQIGE